jgi:hypothetical protein
MKPSILISIAMIALSLLAAPAGATMQYFTSQSAWASATSGVFTIDFEDVAVPTPPGYADYSLTGLQLHDVTFTADVPVDYLWVIKSGTAEDYYKNAWGAGNFLRGSTWGTRYIQAALPSGVNALSMFVLTNVYGGSVTFSFSTGDSHVMSTTADTSPDFIGFVFDQPVGWARLDTNQNFTALDNFAYAQTPEANTIWLLGVGLAALLIARRLRRLRD